MQSAPVGITRLGEQIVVWRNKDGQVQALLYRGASVDGLNLGDRIASRYHGEVAGNGEVKDVPAVANVRWSLLERAAIRCRRRTVPSSCGLASPPIASHELTFPDELAADTEHFSNLSVTAASEM